MAAPDVSTRPIAIAAATIALIVAVATVAVFGLLRLWHSPPGGSPSPGASGAAAMAAAGPALQSAPQVEGAAYRAAKARELAAAEAKR